MTAITNPAYWDTHCTVCASTLDPEVDRCPTCFPEHLACPDCNGRGTVMDHHPRYGQIDCPEPWVETTCGTCHGTGRRWR